MPKKTGGEALKYVIVLAVFFAMGIIIIWAITGWSPWAAPPRPDYVENGDLIKINYTGWHWNRSLFDSGVLEFRPGTMQMLLKGIDEGVLGMRPGESRVLNLTPEYAFGEYNPELLIEQPRVIITSSTITFDTTPEQFNATYFMMPKTGLIISSVDLPWRRVEIVDFNNTTMTWRLMPPENHETSWPLGCSDMNRAVPVAMDCHGTVTMNLTQGGEKLELRIDPFIDEMVSVGGTMAWLRAGNESVYYLDFNHQFAEQGFIYQVELLELEKGI